MPNACHSRQLGDPSESHLHKMSLQSASTEDILEELKR